MLAADHGQKFQLTEEKTRNQLSPGLPSFSNVGIKFEKLTCHVQTEPNVCGSVANSESGPPFRVLWPGWGTWDMGRGYAVYGRTEIPCIPKGRQA